MIPLESDEESRKDTVGPRTHRTACKEIVSEANVPVHYCGEMNLICEECGVKHLKEERP
jgi:hypothetical protein